MKSSFTRTISIFIVVSMLAASIFTVPFSATAKNLKGDLTADGEIDSLDYVLLKRIVMGTYEASATELTAADITGEGQINAFDYLLLKRSVIGTYEIVQDAEDSSDGSSVDSSTESSEASSDDSSAEDTFTPVTFSTTQANSIADDNYIGNLFICTSPTAGQTPYVWLWAAKLLLDYDSATDTWLVVAYAAVGDTSYTNWNYGGNRVILYDWWDGEATEHTDTSSVFPSISVGDVFRCTTKTFAEISSAGQGQFTAVFEQVEPADNTIQKVEVVKPDSMADATPNNIKAVYVPLDDRPVNIDRAIYNAEAAGIELIMPEKYMYATVLGTSGHGGDTVALLEWLKEQEAKTGADKIDYYIISLDQIFSGGLVNSRYSVDNYNGSIDYTHSTGFNDKETADFLIELSKNNFVVYFETMMRLATTENYKDHTSSLYAAFRDYGIKNRKEIDVNSPLFTIDGIVSTYMYGVNEEFYTVDGATTAQLQGYVDARERKLRIFDYLVRGAGANIDHLIIGADDSHPGANLQNNDKKYILNLCDKIGVNYTQFAGADEIGVMALGTLTADLYRPETEGGAISMLPVYVQYYGPGKDWVADGYDTGTLAESVELHIKALNGYVVTNEDDAELTVMVLTGIWQDLSGNYMNDSTLLATLRSNADTLVDDLKLKLADNKAVAIIDASGRYGENNNILAHAMFYGRNGTDSDRLNSSKDFAKLLGFSAWNTVGNKVGLSLGMAFSRLSYLRSGAEVTTESNDAFLKSFTHAVIKDTCYRGRLSSETPDMGATGQWYHATYILNGVVSGTGISGSDILGAYNSASDTFSTVTPGRTVSCGEFTLPWGRNFEATFTITVQ